MALKDNASLALIPVAYKTSKVYSVIPNDNDGDFDFSRSSTGTRVNKGGLIETMGVNIPRLNYPLLDGVVQDCPALLLEPSRTNYLPYSEEFINSGWSKISAGTGSTPIVTADYSISPSGVLDATRIQFDKGAGTGLSNYSLLAEFLSVPSGIDASKSVYLKSNTNSEYDLVLYGTSDASGTNVKKIRITTEWQRFDVFKTITGTATGIAFGLREINVSGLSNTADILAWGAQVENGLYPTSYIPSLTGSQTTRSVDNAQIASNAEDIIGSQNEGTLFIDLEIPYDTTSSDYFQFSISDQNTLPNRVFINFRDGEAKFQVFSDSAPVGFCNTPVTKNIRLKIAASYETDNFVLFKDGFLADDIDTGGTVNFTTQMESIRYADQGNGLKFKAKVYETMFFKEALTQDELEALTSWTSFNEMATEQLYTIE